MHPPAGISLPQSHDHTLLRLAWAGLPAWRVLNTHLGCCAHFFSVWQTWATDPQAPRLLHYVALTATAPSFESLAQAGRDSPPWLALIEEIKDVWFDLTPGFHRLVLGNGRVLLTLCVGGLAPLLREQQFEADAIFLDLDDNDPASTQAWNSWTVKALVRSCRQGTLLNVTPSAACLRGELEQGGFQFNETPLWGTFEPRWGINKTRAAFKLHAQCVSTCAVVGAGLAGASVAAALAKRGWQVTVLDGAPEPASGASGLPVGLVVAHVSKDDCAQSRLSRSGVRLMLQQARQLLRRGQDWAETGVLEKQFESLNDHPPQATGAVAHPGAAWLKPAALVRAWLAQPGVRFMGIARVASLAKNEGQWQLLGANGQELCRAHHVVFANADGALPLLASMHKNQTLGAVAVSTHRLPSVQGMRGLLSWGLHASVSEAAQAHFPDQPVNGSGSVIPWVPLDPALGDGAALNQAWFVGSSYQNDTQPELADAVNHAANLGRLNQLMPELGAALTPEFQTGAVRHWKNTRCVTLDRLPLVGPLMEADHPDLWICAGMGSRGMSFSVLCAELLAAQWGNEPLPVGAALARSLYALRGRGTKAPAPKG
jgi:tRNA 5-methylaminomethyl-2-thiouridine biosynthesis bifunctional protein